MRRKNLLLFTYAFPYGHTEAFLETEIHYLNEVFEKIIIIPASKPAGIRRLPEAITIHDGLTNRSNWSAAARFIDGFRCGVVQPGFWKEALGKPSLLMHGQSLYRLLNMQGGAHYTRRITLDILKSQQLQPSDTVAYSYWLDHFTMGFARLRKEGHDIRCVSRGHRYDIYNDLYTPPHIPYQRQTMEMLDLMVFIAKHGLNHVAGRFPLHPDKVMVSKLGVGDPGFTTSGTGSGELHVVSCSALVPVKRIGMMIGAFDHLAVNNPGVLLSWTHLGDGPLREELENMAKYRLEGKVAYRFAGQMSNRAVMDFYRNNQIDVLLNTSASEGIPVTMMEAQSCGLPVCATSVGGVSEIVDARNGFLMESDPEDSAIADALIQFADPGVRSEKSQLSRRNWEKEYDADKNYREFALRISEL